MPHGRAANALICAASLLLALSLGGCGHTTTVGSSRTVRLAVTEYRLNPQRISATAGTLTIVVHNFGRLTHNLAVLQGVRYAGNTKPLAPGESAQLTLSVLRGTYLLTSTTPSDQALGIYGTLSVR